MTARGAVAERTTPAQVYLDRRIVTATPDRIDIHPARSIIFVPLVTLVLSIAVFPVVYLWSDSLPLWLLTVMTLGAVVIVPVSGMGVVYSIVGAHIVVERHKQSAVLQQGFLGMGVGTQELIPFWKIDHISVEEVTPRQEDIAQFDVTLVKLSEKRIPVGTVTVAQTDRGEGLERARSAADLLAQMAGVKVRVRRQRSRVSSA